MRKETVIKFEKEFIAWCKGESVLKGSPMSMCNRDLYWEEVKDFADWKALDTVYVLNDSYSTYRKAQAEGKTIQFKPSRDSDFKDINMSLDSYVKEYPHFSVSRYRIKSEEPEFKVGDWVRNSICRSDIGKVLEFTDEDYPKTVCLTHNEHCFLRWEHWKPQSEEWCWNTVFGLVKVIGETTEAGKPCYLCWNPWKKLEQKLSNLEPFIGELPSHLKD